MADKVVRKYGTVSMDILAVPTSKAEFVKKYSKRIPDVDKAWKEISALQKKHGVGKESKKED
jgi:hypothetical protein